MKRAYLYLLMAMTVISLNYYGCSGTKNNPDGGGDSGGDPVTIAMNLKPGMTYKLVTKMHQDIDQTIMGQSQSIQQDIDMYMRYEVEDVDAEGIATVKVTYDRVHYSMTNSNPMVPNVTYDSKTDADDANPMAAAFSGLVNQTVTMKQSPTGEVMEVSGVDGMMDNMIEKMGSILSPSEAEEMRAELKKSYSEEALKESFEMTNAFYPKRQVKVGDSWEAAYEMNPSQPMKVNSTYTLDAVTDDEIVLKVDGTIAAANNSMESGGMTIEYSMDGTQGGTVTINRESGMPVRSELKQDVKAEMKMMGMNVPMTIKSTVVVEEY